MTPIPALISVVIPVYNGANYLAEAIDSALAQTYAPVEVLVVDDGSTDGGRTAAVAARYAGRLQYVRKENGGVSSALNRGIAEMQGEWFNWLSHDDRFLPAKLQVQMDYLRAHPDVKVLATGLQVIDGAGHVTSEWSSGRELVIRNGRQVMDNWVYGCSLLIHRSVLERAGGFNESNRTVQDLEMWLKIVHDGFPITMLPDVLCQWRHHGESGSFRQRSAHFAEVDEFLSGIASRYPMAFFHDGEAPVDARAAQGIYGWLGRQALHRGSAARAQAFYRRGLASNPNPFDRSFWRILRQYIASHDPRSHIR